MFLSFLLLACAGQFAFAASSVGTVGVNATVSENININTGEGDVGLDITTGDGTTGDGEKDVTYEATMDSSTLSESEGYDTFTDAYNPQILNEDFSIKNTCKSVNTGEGQASGELQTYNVTITW